jgi:hypothetical protein
MRRNRFRIIVGLIVLLALAALPSATSARRGHAKGSCAHPPYQAHWQDFPGRFVGDRVHTWARSHTGRHPEHPGWSYPVTVEWRPRQGARICLMKAIIPQHSSYSSRNPQGGSHVFHGRPYGQPRGSDNIVVTAAPR